MVRLSLCMVARNASSNLNEFMKKIKDKVDEIIFVDTGSSDHTVKIAESFGAKVFKFEQKEGEWIEEARNLSLKQATCDWIIVLDSDEIIAERDWKQIRELIENNKNELQIEQKYAGYYLVQRQYTNKIGNSGWKSSKEDSYSESKIANGWYENPILRIFINDKRIRYEGKPHDLVDWSVKEIGKVCLTDIPIHHYGELNRDDTGKSERNLGFLKQQLNDENNKEKFYTYYQIACELIGKNELESAEENLKKSLELSEDYAPSLQNLAAIFIKRRKFNEAEKLLLNVVRNEPSADAENNLGIIHSERGELNRALKKFQKALEMNNQSADYNFNIGLTLLKMDKQKKALLFFERAIELNPEYKNKVKFG